MRTYTLNKYLLIILSVILLVSGCASSVTSDIVVEVEAEPKANFKDYSRYKWLGSAAIVYDPKGKWEVPNFDADSEIKFHIDTELRARGMTEDSLDADLVVAFSAGIDMESMDIDIDPESNLTTLENVPLGTLIVVLVDAKTGLAIWAGSATAEIQESPGEEAIKKRIAYAVRTMFKKFPK
jgi:hypothetical protein